MTMQPPLLDSNAPIILPGPQFTPRPGWGGRLGLWWRNNGRLAAFQILLLLALGLIARSVWIHNTGLLGSTPAPSVPAENTLSVMVNTGDHLTRVTTKALNLYLSETGTTLDSVQRLYVITTLVQRNKVLQLLSGTTVSFSINELAELVAQAKTLTPAQRSSWAKYLQ